MMRVLAISSLFLTLTGCASVGGEYRREPVKVPAAWGVSLPTGDMAQGGFWPGFGDAQLVSLIDRALTDSHGMAEAAARVREARAMAIIAGSRAQPQVDASAALKSDRASDNSRFPLTGLKNPVMLYQGGFDAAWEFDLFGGLRRDREAAEAELEAAGLRR